MKRLISVLVIVAMLAATFATVIPTFAAKISDEATATYNVNWASLDGNMESQWNGDVRNDYKTYFTVNTSDTQISSESKNGGDTRAYYSNTKFDITETTYYEYVFEAKNNDNSHKGYAGVIFAYSGKMPYFMYGAFQNDSDAGKKADLKLRYGHNDGRNEWVNSLAETPVVKAIDDDGKGNHFGRYKVVFDGFDVSFYYYDENDQFVEIFVDKTITLAKGSKVCFGVYSRDSKDGSERNVVLKNCVLTAYNAESAAILNDASEANISLSASIDAAELVADGTYTPATKAVLEAALTAAKAGLEDADADLAALKADLDAAIAGLKMPADKTALAEKLVEAENKVEGKEAEDFESGYLELELAYTAAMDLYNDNEASQEDVDNAVANLTAAIMALTEKDVVNKAYLEAAIAAYEALNEDDYTPASWNLLNGPYVTAIDLFADDSANQADVDSATDALNTAIEELVERADFSALQDAIDVANDLDEEDYFADSWATLVEPLNAANIAIINYNLTQAEVDVITEALNDALATLIGRINVMGGSNANLQFEGKGDVFYYDYHKYIVAKNYTAGEPFAAMSQADKGDSNYMLRLGNNGGSGTASVSDGNKVDGPFSHNIGDVEINGTTYGHGFGYSFRMPVTVDSTAIYLPTNTTIESIDVYGAVITEVDGEKVYGKDADKVFLGSVTVPAAVEGAQNIVAELAFEEALKVDYIFFAVKFKEGTMGSGSVYKIFEIEVFGLKEGAADFTALKDAYAKYNVLVETDYTEESWNNLADVVALTDPVNKTCLSLADDIDNAANILTEAIGKLEAKPADKSALEAKVNEVKDNAEGNYTPATWGAFADALANAQTVLQTENLLQSEVDNAVTALDEAIAALVEQADKTALKKAIEDAKALKAEDYEAGIIWNLFVGNIADAEAVLNDGNATAEEVAAAIDNLNASKAVLTPVTPLTPPATDDPATDAPATDAPATDAPATDAPATDAPATDAPATDAPATDDPETEAPETEAPETEAPETEAPETEAPETEAPETEVPETEAPETEAPATSAPVTDAPVTDATVEEDGCGSSIALSALAVVGIIGTAVVIKKKED